MGEKEHAQRCVSAVNAYWAARGFNVNARLAPGKTEYGKELTAVYEIQSDTENGMPRGCDGRLVPVYGAPRQRAEQ